MADNDAYVPGLLKPEQGEARRKRPVPEMSEARRKAFSVRAMTLEELDEALAHVGGRQIATASPGGQE